MLEYLFAQYHNYSSTEITLEFMAIFFGGISVLFALKNNIFVYPTGIISTSIFIYLLIDWNLIGDMIINVYYTIMSLYAWYIWTLKKNKSYQFPISTMNTKDYKKGGIYFISTSLFVLLIYILWNKLEGIISYIDILTTGLFFVGMWLLAYRKIENWIIWIIADLISIPLYFYKGHPFTGIFYLYLTSMAIIGYYLWKNKLNKQASKNKLKTTELTGKI